MTLHLYNRISGKQCSMQKKSGRPSGPLSINMYEIDFFLYCTPRSRAKLWMTGLKEAAVQLRGENIRHFKFPFL